MYDIILADAYQDITVPFHMSTVEFFTEVKSTLKPGGILIVNINMRSGDFTGVPEYLSGTVKKVFKHAYRVDLEFVNQFTAVFVSDNDNMLENYRKNAPSAIPKEHDLYDISQNVMADISEVPSSDLVLTDDLAPVEVLGKKSLDKIVAKELEAFSAGLRQEPQ
jgi:spermidine synthase